MRIAIPRMGNLRLIIEDLVQRFDLEYVETPVFSEETMRIGAALAPELACLPLKAVLGNFIQVLEKGADTLVMGGGSGPCRFGYYAEIQRRILAREGYRFDMVILDPPGVSVTGFYRSLRSIVSPGHARFPNLVRQILLALKKVVVYEEMEKWALAIRGLESRPGAVDAALAESRRELSESFSASEIETAREDARMRFGEVPFERDRPHLRIGLVGEIFVVLEPYFNFEIETWLARRGIAIERAVHVADTVYPGGRNPVFGYSEEEIASAAAPYLCHEVGGDGLLSVGATVIFARRGFDAVVHFLPFTCMPEVIAKSVLARVSEELDIPVLSLTIDEQTGRAGVQTRLEALLDLARARAKRAERAIAGSVMPSAV